MVTDKLRRNIFYALLGLVLITFLYAGQVAKRQEDEALLQYYKFQEAEKYMQNENYGRAIVLLKDLVKTNSKSYKVYWYYGVCLTQTGHFKEADYYLVEASKRFPQLYFNQVYLYTRAIVNLHLGRNKDAKKFFEASIKYGNDIGLNNEIKKYLNNINGVNYEK